MLFFVSTSYYKNASTAGHKKIIDHHVKALKELAYLHHTEEKGDGKYHKSLKKVIDHHLRRIKQHVLGHHKGDVNKADKELRKLADDHYREANNYGGSSDEESLEHNPFKSRKYDLHDDEGEFEHNKNMFNTHTMVGDKIYALTKSLTKHQQSKSGTLMSKIIVSLSNDIESVSKKGTASGPKKHVVDHMRKVHEQHVNRGEHKAEAAKHEHAVHQHVKHYAAALHKGDKEAAHKHRLLINKHAKLAAHHLHAGHASPVHAREALKNNSYHHASVAEEHGNDARYGKGTAIQKRKSRALAQAHGVAAKAFDRHIKG